MKLFHFHTLLIRSFVLYVLTCLLISQSALSDTLPDPSLCPSSSSPASEAGAEAGAEAGLPPENFRTFLRSAIENLPANHDLFLDQRYQSIIDALREQADIAPPADVTDFLDEMERRVETLNNQITVNDSNRLQLVQPRNAFTFPLTVIHAFSDGVLDRDTVYGMASRIFVILQMLFPVRETDTGEQQSARQQLISSLYEALLIHSLLKPSASVFLKITLEAYINSYQSQLPPHLQSDTTVLTAVNLTGFEVSDHLFYSRINAPSRLFIPDSVRLHRRASHRPAAVMERTLNNVSYMALISFSQPPVTVTISPDQSEIFLQNVRDVHNSTPVVDRLRETPDSSDDESSSTAISQTASGNIPSAAIGLMAIHYLSKSNADK